MSRDPAKDGWNWYQFVDNDPKNSLDPEGLACIRTRPLSGLTFGVGDQKKFGVKSNGVSGYSLSHAQIFYDDGKNEGYFNDGLLRPDNNEYLDMYQDKGNCGYVDCIMKIAARVTKPKPYCLLGVGKDKYNCHDWVNEVVETYHLLENVEWVKKKCGITECKN